MHPDLLTLGPWTLHTYGLMVALGFGLSVWLAWRQAGREGLPQDLFLDMAFWALLAGLAGARLLYVVVSWDQFRGDVWGVFRVWQGGLVFYGGFLGGLAAVIVVALRYRLPVWRMLDLGAPYAALGHAIGRLGCFFNGCCYGLPTSSVCGVRFPVLGDGLTRWPTQLFESAFNLLLFAFLVAWRPRRRFHGQLFWLYLALYAAGRFLLEFLRGDAIRGAYVLPWLHTSQIIAVVILLISLVMLFILPKRIRMSGTGSAR